MLPRQAEGRLFDDDFVDCAQAQTVANFYLAFDLELAIVPVLNKIDLPAADPEKVAEQVQQVSAAVIGKVLM